MLDCCGRAEDSMRFNLSTKYVLRNQIMLEMYVELLVDENDLNLYINRK